MNVQGARVGVTHRNSLFIAQVIPVPLHRTSLNAVMADGHAVQFSRSEFQQPGGPAVPLQDGPKQNWGHWRSEFDDVP